MSKNVQKHFPLFLGSMLSVSLLYDVPNQDLTQSKEWVIGRKTATDNGANHLLVITT